MRLPVTPQLSTKDGISNKNARLTNTLKESGSTGDFGVVRPGLVEAAASAGNGNGLVCFNGELVSIFGAELGAGIEEGTGYDGIFYVSFDNTIEDSIGDVVLQGNGSQGFVTNPAQCGTYSYRFETNGSFLAANSPAGLLVGASDFTVEAWVYIPVDGVDSLFVFEINDQIDNIFTFSVQGFAPQLYWSNSTDLVSIVGSDISAEEWHHIAIVRSGDAAILYIDGTVDQSDDVSTFEVTVADPEDFDFIVGNGDAYISQLGFADYARYTEDFTPACFTSGGGKTIPSVAPVTNTKYDFVQSTL